MFTVTTPEPFDEDLTTLFPVVEGSPEQIASA
jgi:hypothetical protein